jgi:hypothetical protein
VMYKDNGLSTSVSRSTRTRMHARRARARAHSHAVSLTHSLTHSLALSLCDRSRGQKCTTRSTGGSNGASKREKSGGARHCGEDGRGVYSRHDRNTLCWTNARPLPRSLSGVQRQAAPLDLHGRPLVWPARCPRAPAMRVHGRKAHGHKAPCAHEQLRIEVSTDRLLWY